jgi:hypothetical protein
MSSTVRIGLVAEGVTDYEVLNASIESMMKGRSFELKLLQPEESVAFTGHGDAGPLGGGWRGVYKWCQLAMTRGDSLRDDPLFLAYDLLILHLDADVAGEDPANYAVHPIPALRGILPCEKPCPHPSHTTDALRSVLLSWVGESEIPPKTVLCTPSKCTETWIVAIFFPNDREMKKKGWECHPEPEKRLGQQRKEKRFSKSVRDYRQRAAGIQDGWSSIVGRLTEARRFERALMELIGELSE